MLVSRKATVLQKGTIHQVRYHCMDFISDLLAGHVHSFVPHGHCFLWTPFLVWGMVTADLLIAASYYSIPIALIYYFYRHGYGPFKQFAWQFSLFIFLCGTTHLIYIWNIWHCDYYLETLAKLLTGFISFYVAVLVWKHAPSLSKLPSLTQLEKLNTQLVESEARYRGLFETANEGVWLLDIEGNTIMANNAMAEILGTRKEELKDRSVYSFAPPEKQQEVSEKLRSRLDGKRDKYEFTFLRKDGSTIHTLISTGPTYDKQGKVNGILGVITDLSEKVKMLKDLNTLNHELEARVAKRTTEFQKLNDQLVREMRQSEEALRKAKDANIRLDAIFNSTPNGMIITDKNGIITEVNTATESMFGYQKSELINQHVNILVPADFASDHNKYINNADTSLTTKKLGFGRKLQASRRYDRQFPVDVALTKLAISDKYYYMAVIRDLTELDVVESELRQVNDRLLKSIDNLREQSRETRLLNEYTEMLQSCQNLEDYPGIINSYCQSLFHCLSAEIFLVDKNDCLTTIVPKNPQTFTTNECWALKSNHPYPNNVHQQKVPCKHLRNNENKICLPLTAKGRTLGLIVLHMSNDFTLSEEALDPQLEQSIQAFAVRTSISLANMRLLKEREEQSYHDELTDLYNRRFMNESLSNYLPRAKRENVPVTALMIDIDHFKKLNDQFGHAVGDAALVQVGQCIESSMRETDLVGRFGGEEFLCILYDANEEEGFKKAEVVHEVIKTINTLPVPITVSIGVAQCAPQDKAEDLIHNADLALYDAKEGGRNQTQRFTMHKFTPTNGNGQRTDKR